MIRQVLEKNGQDESIPDSLRFENIKNSVVRDTTPEEIIEKHALLDVLTHGKDIFENLEEIDFTTSQKIIEIYSDVQKVDASKIQKMKVFHYK